MAKFAMYLLVLFFVVGCSDDVIQGDPWTLSESNTVVTPIGAETPPYRDGGETLGGFTINSDRDMRLTALRLRVNSTHNVYYGGFSIKFPDGELYGLETFNSNQVDAVRIDLKENPLQIDKDVEIRLEIVAGLEVVGYDEMTFEGTSIEIYITDMEYDVDGATQTLTFAEEIKISSYTE